MDTPITHIKPPYNYNLPTKTTPQTIPTEPPQVQKTIKSLHLTPHIEGGYFAETDRDPRRVPNPFTNTNTNTNTTTAANTNTSSPGRSGSGSGSRSGSGLSNSSPDSTTTATATAATEKPATTTTETKTNPETTRSASTSILYYLTPNSPLGAFHRNRARTVHTLHRGRGRYVVIHADEVVDGSGSGGNGNEGSNNGNKGSDNDNDSGSNGSGNGNGNKKAKARIESFVVGHDIEHGERLQWVVDGGKFKASYLLPDCVSTCTGSGGTGTGESNDGDGGSKLGLESNPNSGGLLISETVVPGFEYSDHDFLRLETMEDLLKPEEVKELKWMLRRVESG